RVGTLGSSAPWLSLDALPVARLRCACYHTSALHPSDRIRPRLGRHDRAMARMGWPHMPVHSAGAARLQRVPCAVEDDFAGVALATSHDLRARDISTGRDRQHIPGEAFGRQFRVNLRLQRLTRFEGTPQGGSGRRGQREWRGGTPGGGAGRRGGGGPTGGGGGGGGASVP